MLLLLFDGSLLTTLFIIILVDLQVMEFSVLQNMTLGSHEEEYTILLLIKGRICTWIYLDMSHTYNTQTT